MKIENHISDILQLYEFSMAIGKSLNYKESCDVFLKLILKRKNLNAAWILEYNENQITSRYSIPLGQEINHNPNPIVSELLNSIQESKIIDSNSIIEDISPIDIQNGTVAIFSLAEQGFLFLFSKKDNLKTKDLLQLQPVINKFSVGLKACKAFSEQQQLLNNLESRNQELSDYAHMVSHDLKSPLRSIDTLTSWLEEDYKEKFDKQGKQQLHLIRNSVEKMDTLINGILEYSTIAKNQIETYDVDVNTLIEDILKIIQVPNHITITTHELPIIKGDKYRLQQLFQNLIDNAILYNDKPIGTISIGANDKDGFWEFYISDNGKGIDNVYFDKIFKTFESLESNMSSTGIGLSIVKKIVNLYGGNIWLISKLNEGTTFYFTLKKH
ncbi:ATP-binding protein [uncultured Psychroserpens sp.]|uniref:sensor histidine kinase n=1 Tax=uncultured Psychroserpens sp. TaxID=255436 RepID=UPI00262A12BE|nr:ATP-binding protein [uncultured Psychroserpens sp.]